jgi:hypothetical protein
MAWRLRCNDLHCGQDTWVPNIVNLVKEHTLDDGTLKCSHCQKPAHIAKNFELQEPGETWEPYLRGVIALGEPGGTYQPFVFLVSYEADGEITSVWFSYYKDLRHEGGRLKLGHGPGGPPVLTKQQVLALVGQLLSTGILTPGEIEGVLRDHAPRLKLR